MNSHVSEWLPDSFEDPPSRLYTNTDKYEEQMAFQGSRNPNHMTDLGQSVSYLISGYFRLATVIAVADLKNA